ncbi:MAG: DUF177 domain-containing protein, partial [Actinomycetia bacterium]|nr:DUF177 domain-containing protein [Actinomycetes bacterium]
MEDHFKDVSLIIGRPGEELSLSGEVTLEAVKLGEELIETPSPLHVDVLVSGINDDVIIKGNASGKVRLRCSRCLAKFDYEASTSIDELATEDIESGAKDEAFPIVNGKIDLAAMVFQNLMVEIPMQPLCAGSCAGICPECGKN